MKLEDIRIESNKNGKYLSIDKSLLPLKIDYEDLEVFYPSIMNYEFNFIDTIKSKIYKKLNLIVFDYQSDVAMMNRVEVIIKLNGEKIFEIVNDENENKVYFTFFYESVYLNLFIDGHKEFIKKLGGSSPNNSVLLANDDGIVKVFPSYEEVFNDLTEKHKLIFFPLLSVKKYDQIFHFVDVWNDGNSSKRFDCKSGSSLILRFKLIDRKYSLMEKSKILNFDDSLIEWYNEGVNEFLENKKTYTSLLSREKYAKSKREEKEEQRYNESFNYGLYVDQVISFLSIKNRYEKTDKLISQKAWPLGYEIKFYNPINQFGEVPNFENPVSYLSNRNDLMFIGSVIGFRYLKNGADSIYLFYDRLNQEAIQIFQVT